MVSSPKKAVTSVVPELNLLHNKSVEFDCAISFLYYYDNKVITVLVYSVHCSRTICDAVLFVASQFLDLKT